MGEHGKDKTGKEEEERRIPASLFIPLTLLVPATYHSSMLRRLRACLVAVLILVVIDAYAGDTSAPVDAAPASQATIWSVYTGADLKDFADYERWIGKPAGAILGYTGQASWADYDGSVPWAKGLFSKLDRRVLWSIPLIPKGANLADAAKGLYNDHYEKAARELAT